MGKRIVFCCDGTWDTPENDTNVYRIFKAILTTHEQVAYYDDGVGSDGTPLEKLAGGALGIGLFGKIKDAYTKIAHAYEDGDEIFIFGFSRGAYTARSLAGMIAVCGLPTLPFGDDFVDTAFGAYRQPPERAAILGSLAKFGMVDAKIKMIGVWDTVGSLGIPAAFGGVGPEFQFLDTSLHRDVLNAYHALSIDERRCEFPPTLWKGPAAPGQTLEQIWFAGSHCDVGGGYAERGLADITLEWMMGKASALGLEFSPDVWTDGERIGAEYALGILHESWSVLWAFPRTRAIASDAALSNSVAIRVQNDGSYRPGN